MRTIIFKTGQMNNSGLFGIPMALLLFAFAYWCLWTLNSCVTACSIAERPGDYFKYGLGGIALLAMGVGAIWDTVYRLKNYRRVGYPQLSVSPTVLAPGDNFRFFYRQTCEQAVEFGFVGTYLVFRETVEYYHVSEWEEISFERLVQGFAMENVSCRAGEDLVIDLAFEIPNLEMGSRHPFKGLCKMKPAESAWYIKVIIEPRKLNQFYAGCKLDVQGAPNSNRLASISEAELFDLYLLGRSKGSFENLYRALCQLNPNMYTNPAGDDTEYVPYLLRERLTKAEAEAAKAQIEKAGGILEIRPAWVASSVAE